jgi:hypothetical protein
MKFISSLILFFVLLGVLRGGASFEDFSNTQEKGINKEIQNQFQAAITKRKDYVSCTSATCGSYSEFLRGLPRYTYDGSRLTRDWSPRSRQYQQSLYIIGMPFAVVSGLILLGGLMLLVSTFALYCSKGRCVLSDYQPAKRSRTYLIMRFFLVAISIFVSVVAIIGLLSTVSLHKTVKESVGAIIDTENRIVKEDVNVVVQLLKELHAYNQVITPEVANVILQMNEIYNISLHEEEKIFHDETLRVASSSMIFSSVWVFVILSVIAFWLLWQKTTFALAVLTVGIVIASVQPINMTIHIPLSTFLADMCPTIEEKLTTSPKQQWIEYYLTCKGQSPFVDVVANIKQKESDMEKLLEYAEQNGWPQSSIENFKEILAELRSLACRVEDLASCDKAMQAWKSSYQNLCNHGFNSLFLITLTGLINSLLVIPLVLIYHYLFTYPRRVQRQEYFLLDPLNGSYEYLPFDSQKTFEKLDRLTDPEPRTTA